MREIKLLTINKHAIKNSLNIQIPKNYLQKKEAKNYPKYFYTHFSDN